jgi:hypothetical protein
MNFRIKDLMISDLSAAAPERHLICGVKQISCIDRSKIEDPGCKFLGTYAGEFDLVNQAHYLIHQCYYTFPCGGCTFMGTCRPSVVTVLDTGVTKENSLTALSTLKDQLRQQLAEVEKQQATLEAGLLPQTVEEVDKLSNKLHEALEELKARRAELSK